MTDVKRKTKPRTAGQKAKNALRLFGKGLYLLAGVLFKVVQKGSRSALDIRHEINQEIEDEKVRSEKRGFWR